MKSKKLHTWFHIILTIFSCFVKAIVWGIAGLAFITTGGFILASKKAPFDIILGIPMVVIGIGFVVHAFADTGMCVFSPRYNKAICLFCSNNIHVND